MGNDYGREDRREGSRWLRWTALWVVVALVVAGLITAGIWAIGVFTAPVRGQGDAIQKKYSAENWTAAQRRFEFNFQDIRASDTKIGLARENLKADPSDTVLKTNLAGLQSYCLSVVADYNTDARTFLSSDFRAADLPYQIDTANPATDCK